MIFEMEIYGQKMISNFLNELLWANKDKIQKLHVVFGFIVIY